MANPTVVTSGGVPIAQVGVVAISIPDSTNTQKTNPNILMPLGVNLSPDAITALGNNTGLAAYATQTYQEFEFKTKTAPQIGGVEGAYWEQIPLASFPPSFDVSIPNSFTNAVSTAINNISDSFAGAANTLNTLTQNLQNAVCAFDSLVDSLKNAQDFAQQFADSHNKCHIYVRAIGLQPVGTITSSAAFIGAVRNALNDTGTDPGEIPLIVPAPIPLDPTAIANALRSGGSFLDQNINLGGFVGNALGKAGVSAGVGLGLGTLSNDINFQPVSQSGGFPPSGVNAGFAATALIRQQGSTMEVDIATVSVDPTQVQKVTIVGASNPNNNGTFPIVSVSTAGVTSGAQKILYTNAAGATEVTTNAKVSPSGAGNIAAADLIKQLLDSQGLLKPNAPKTIPVSTLLDLLVQGKLIGVNADVAEQDKSIATERLARLTGPTDLRVGGMVLVGQAPDLAKLSAKVGGLSKMITFLQPLAEQLATTAAQQIAAGSSNPTGIDFDPTEISLTKLNAANNVGIKDVQSVQDKVNSTGVASFTMPQLQSLAANGTQPAANNFNAWRFFSPSDFIEPLKILGDSEAAISSASAQAVADTFGTLSGLIQQGQSAVTDGLTNLQGQATAIKSMTDKMNALNTQFVQGVNFLKDQIGTGPLKIEGHLIGPKLDLLSNDQFADQVAAAVQDFTDPNRPTFGPPAASSILDNQNALTAALTGHAATVLPTGIWFGILVFIVGSSSQDLGEQMSTMTDILSMDGSAIALPAKKKLSLNL